MTAPSDQVLAAVAERIELVAPGYLERVRRATHRLAARPAGAGGDLRAALEDLADVVNIDVDVPTGSNRRSAGVVKAAVKRLIGWYLRYLGQQVTVAGQSMARLGELLVARTEELDTRTEELDARTEELKREVGSLEARVTRLEQPAPLERLTRLEQLAQVKPPAPLEQHPSP